MKHLELLELLTKAATAYRGSANASIARNVHMHAYRGLGLPPEAIDAILVDFINYVGIRGGVDYALYSTDLASDTSASTPS